MRHPRWPIDLLGLALLSAAGPGLGAAAAAPSPATLTLPGQIVPFQSALLTAKVAGYLRTITVDKGDQVKAGALIAELEVPELLADQAQYQAQARVANDAYQRLQQAAKSAPDLVTVDSVDAARGRMEVAQAQLDRVRILLKYARITAPFAGTITARYADPGAYVAVVTGGTAQSAALVNLMDFNRVRVQIAVPEADASRVRRGTPAVITVRGLSATPISAAVSRISYALDTSSRTMLAEIDLPNPGARLRPGMYVSVQLTASDSPDAEPAPLRHGARER